MLKDLAEIVSIESVQDTPSGKNAPFGENLRKALDWFLNKARSYGLETGENNGYYGWADYGDKSKPAIGILTHIDIVPVGEGWDTDPLTVTKKGDMLYGRGVSDDKGALCMALHLLKKFKEEKREFSHRIRLIVGCNEESGCECLKKYRQDETDIPVVSLVPDSHFPVTYCEKGIAHIEAFFRPDSDFKANFESLVAGQRANVVPEKAQFKLLYNGFSNGRFLSFRENFLDLAMPKKYTTQVGFAKDDFTVESENGASIVTVKGKSAHGSTPQKGKNAVWGAWAFIAGSAPHNNFTKEMLKLCSPDADEYLGLRISDEKSGALTMNMGITEYFGDNVKVTFDFRLPLGIDADTVCKALESLPFCVGTNIVHRDDILFVDPNSKLVTTLMDVYKECTGDSDARPLLSGGGTYAKTLPNALAFGISMPSAPDKAHEANEQISLSALNKTSEIYEKAIIALDKIY